MLAEQKTLAGGSKTDEEGDALAMARYLADMTGQLETMARAARMELLAYLLAMARAEAESLSFSPSSDLRTR